MDFDSTGLEMSLGSDNFKLSDSKDSITIVIIGKKWRVLFYKMPVCKNYLV